jgi:hypothetical protein
MKQRYYKTPESYKIHRNAIQKWKNKMYEYWTNNGNCGRCGQPCAINKFTGKPFKECLHHRRINAANAQKMRERRNVRKTQVQVRGD